MTDKTEFEIQRGERARLLMEDELLQDAFATIEKEYMDSWLNSPERDVEGRERLRLMIKTLQRLKLELQNVMETGQIARATLAQRVGQKLNQYF